MQVYGLVGQTEEGIWPEACVWTIKQISYCVRGMFSLTRYSMFYCLFLEIVFLLFCYRLFCLLVFKTERFARYIHFSRFINWWKGKPSESIACTRTQQPRFYWSCSSVVMNDATPLTPPSAWAELYFQM